MPHPYATRSIAELYRWFAGETRPTSPVWGRLCSWIATDEVLLTLLDRLAGIKRQPNLFLAGVRFLGGPTTPGDGFRAWVLDHWQELERVILARSTQTNEPGRCVVLAPVLAALPQPISLIEFGSAAGLCLIPDRYRYETGDQLASGSQAGEDAPLLNCASQQGNPPGRIEDLVVQYRAGYDLAPLAASNEVDAAWLRALIWPGQPERESTLEAALSLASKLKVSVDVGDLLTDLVRSVEECPQSGSVVVQCSAVLQYLTRTERAQVIATLRDLGVHWVTFEGGGVLDFEVRRPSEPHFVLAVDGRVAALASPHIGWVKWI